MIAYAYLYLVCISLLAASALYLSKKEYKALQYLPPIVLLYMITMLLSSWGLFEKNEEITQSYTTLKSNLLPAMIFLMLIPNKMTEILRLGPKMLFAFLFASLSLISAFILVFMLFRLEASDIEILTPLAGSWMGGTGNMLAVASAIHSSENAIGITMLIDSVDYSLWVMFLLMLVPFSKRFNAYTKASDPVNDADTQNSCALSFSYRAYFWLLFSALTISLLSQVSGVLLSGLLIGSPTTWSVLLATAAGILFSFTPLADIKGINGTAKAMLYLLIALIASRADIHFELALFSYLLAGLAILSLHAFLMFVFAKLFRFDLFTLSVASLANIGGIASAPILCAAYSQSMVGIGVLMASLGYIIGTFAALFLYEVLSWLV